MDNKFPLRMLTSLSVDEILLPKYVKWSANFRCLLFNVEMALYIYIYILYIIIYLVVV